MKLSKHFYLLKRVYVYSVLVILFHSSCSQKQAQFHSDHFTIEQLAEGVYAAIHTPGGEAICNAGIIDLGGKTLVFDCFLTPRAAYDLKRMAEELTGNPITYVVNSHYHNDHIRGNQVFDEETIIISTPRIRQLIKKNEPEEIKSEKEYAPTWLSELETEYEQTTDSTRKEELIMWIAYVKGMLDSHPTLKTVLPDSIFRSEMEIKGRKRSVRLIEFFNAHTENDIIMTVENEKIIFCGDLLFVDCHPYLAHGDPFHLIEVLKEIKQMDAHKLIPGHGPVGNNLNIDELISYIVQLQGLSNTYILEKKTEEDIIEDDIPEDFAHWIFPNFFKYNMDYMINANPNNMPE